VDSYFNLDHPDLNTDLDLTCVKKIRRFEEWLISSKSMSKVHFNVSFRHSNGSAKGESLFKIFILIRLVGSETSTLFSFVFIFNWLGEEGN
jgi:hypothetical protein